MDKERGRRVFRITAKCLPPSLSPSDTAAGLWQVYSHAAKLKPRVEWRKEISNATQRFLHQVRLHHIDLDHKSLVLLCFHAHTVFISNYFDQKCSKLDQMCCNDWLIEIQMMMITSKGKFNH